MFDFRQAMPGAPQQDFPPMIEPFAEHFGKAKDLRDAAFHQHVHVERNTAFELGELEKRLHHQFGVNRTRPRLDDQPDIFGRFIAYVSNQRQLFLVDQFGERSTRRDFCTSQGISLMTIT